MDEQSENWNYSKADKIGSSVVVNNNNNKSEWFDEGEIPNNTFHRSFYVITAPVLIPDSAN